MTTLVFPPLPPNLSTELNYVSKSAIQNPPLGGAKTRIGRNGDYWTLKFAPQTLRGEQAQSLLGYIEMASSYAKARVPIRQYFKVTDQGTMCVDGAGQKGRILSIRHVPNGFPFTAGMMFNIVSDGSWNLHRLVSFAPVEGSVTGQYVLQINPGIKAPNLADGDHLEFVAPAIEGWVIGDVGQSQSFGGGVSTTVQIEEAA